MPDLHDAFGQVLLDYYKSGTVIPHIIERCDGYIDTDNADFYFQPFDAWMDVEREAIGHAFGNILDVGAGAGRVSLYLQEKGLFVTALDNSPLAMEVCKLRGVNQTLCKPFMSLSKRDGIFDTLVLFGNNFGLFQSRHKMLDQLVKLNRIMPDNALIIAHVLDPYRTDLPEHLTYQRTNRDLCRMSGQVRIRIRYKTLKTPYFDYLFASQEEILDIVKNSAWHVERFIGTDAQYCVLLRK